jgi:hypothetical protein
MMSDPIDDALANAQREAFKALPGANVTPLRASIGARPAGPLCIGVDAFLAGTDAPVWVIGGLLQTNYVYALTAPTNHGKTAVSLVMALCVAAGRTFAGRPVTSGNVLILCGENQDGFRLRMMATMESLSISLAEIKRRVWVLPEAGSLALYLEQIKKDAAAMEPLAMVLVDTSVAFFSGDNENDNAQAYEHARYLRELSLLPGKPAVVANCHPAAGAGKDMTRDSCVPRGGSAFLNEIDTNLSVWSEGDFAELHWMRKKRGPDFAPILFEYRGVNIQQHDTVVASIVAVHIDEERQKAIRKKHKEHESRVLFEMNANPVGTIRDWGIAAGFTIKTGHFAGQAHVSGVMRILERLKKYKLAERSERDGWILTASGKKEAQEIR